MPIYRGRRANTWRVTVYSRGEQHEWIVEGTKRDARRWEDERRAELRKAPVAPTRNEPTFSDFCVSHYRLHAALHLGAKTWRERRYQLARLCEHFGALRVSQLSAEAIDAYKQTEIARGIRPSSVNTSLRALRAALGWGATQGLVDVIPKVKLLPEDGERRVHWWTTGQVRALYASAAQRWPAGVPLLHFLLETGCRKGELCAADWEWVDWDAAMLRIPVTRWWRPKNKRPREVPLSPALLATLRKLGPRTGPIFRATSAQCRGARFKEFPDEPYRIARNAAGLSGGAHTTRHTFASHFLASRPDLGLLAEVLGQSQLRVTELYAHMLPERLARARGAVQLAPPRRDWARPKKAANQSR